MKLLNLGSFSCQIAFLKIFLILEEIDDEEMGFFTKEAKKPIHKRMPKTLTLVNPHGPLILLKAHAQAVINPITKFQ